LNIDLGAWVEKSRAVAYDVTKSRKIEWRIVT
jgi:hypothetical protein